MAESDLVKEMIRIGDMAGPFKLRYILPDIYSYFLNRAKYLLSKERREYAKQMIDSIDVYFMKNQLNSDGGGLADFHVVNRVIRIGFGVDFIDELTEENIRKYLNKNHGVIGSIIHELAHSIQNFFERADVFHKVYEERAETDKNPYELSAILENIWYYKKQGKSLDDFINDRVKTVFRYVVKNNKISFLYKDDARDKIIDILSWRHIFTRTELEKKNLSELVDIFKKDVYKHISDTDPSILIAKKYWDKVKLQRKEVQKDIFAKDLQLKKLANQLEQIGFFDEADYVDGLIKMATGKEPHMMTYEEYKQATGYPKQPFSSGGMVTPELRNWWNSVKDFSDVLREAINQGKTIPQHVIDSLPIGDKTRLFPESVGQAPWQLTQQEFEDKYLVHGTAIKPGDDITFIEPRIGDFTREMYSGSVDGDLEDYGAKELAYFKPASEADSVGHYATGVDVYKKEGEPYILLADKPGDVLYAKEDGLYDEEGYLVSRDLPLGVEPGDIVSEEGADVRMKIPYRQYAQREQYLDSLHKYLVWQALQQGKPVSEEVLKDYPDLKRNK